jgi:DNA polymerase-3 subunit alpha
MGINVLPPDINESFRAFSVTGDNIRFGLSAVKNVGTGAVDSVIEARKREGKFSSFYDFCSKVDSKKINKKVLESLIKCGAFDSIERGRRTLMEGFEQVVEFAQKRNSERAMGQLNLFEQPNNDIQSTMEIRLPDVPEWEHDELLSYEKETLGFYITGHPLTKFKDRLNLIVNTTSEDIINQTNESIVSIAGVVSNVREVSTKKKETMAYVTLEDMKGYISVIVFPELYRNSTFMIHSDDPIFIRGKVDAGDEGAKVIATEISTIEEAVKTPVSSIHFIVDSQRLTNEDIYSLRELLGSYRGNYKGFIHIKSARGGEAVIYLGDKFKLNVCDAIKEKADELLGVGSTFFK